MVYTALPDRRIPYDNDGTVVGWCNNYASNGLTSYPSGSSLAEWQDEDTTVAQPYWWDSGSGLSAYCIWMFFPEQREITAGVHLISSNSSWVTTLMGSNNSGNGVDGTWETASTPAGSITQNYYQFDNFRTQVRAISFTGTKKIFRLENYRTGNGFNYVMVLHLFGEKGAGQTPDDIIYINHDDTPGVEYTAPEDFGDQPLGTTVVRQFRVKNVSATKTANTINIQCNDSDFAISTDNANWVVTINISSLAAGAESSTMYVRCTTPAQGNLLGPRFARIVTTVASYT